MTLFLNSLSLTSMTSFGMWTNFPSLSSGGSFSMAFTYYPSTFLRQKKHGKHFGPFILLVVLMHKQPPQPSWSLCKVQNIMSLISQSHSSLRTIVYMAEVLSKQYPPLGSYTPPYGDMHAPSANFGLSVSSP